MKNRILKVLSCTSLTTSLLVGSCTTSPYFQSCAMDNPAAQHQGTATSQSSSLSLALQNTLTGYGYEILSEVISDQGFDVANSNLFNKFNSILQPELSGALYSSSSSYAPSNLLRWCGSSTDQNYITTRKNQILSIISIGWALSDLAKNQGDAFQRGSFSLIDPHHRLYNFLLDYVKLTTGYNDPQQVPYLLTGCNFSYRRDPNTPLVSGSSHHKDHCPESQFGIDVRFEPWEGVYQLLPFDCTHLLFAKINIGSSANPQTEPLLFVKFEPLGTGSAGAALFHGLHFIHSQANVGNQDRREKDVLPVIKDSFEKLRTAANLNGEFKKIRPMVLAAEAVLITPANYSADVVQSASDFMDLLNRVYPNGNNHLRVGNEVVVDLWNLKQ